MKVNQRLIVLLSMLLISGIASSSLYADQLEDQVRKIAHELRCPTCQGLSVKESEAGLSLNMKSKIRDMLIAGKSKAEILQFFEERYGEWILRSPKKAGFNLLLWGLPGLLIVLISGLLLFKLKKKSIKENRAEIAPLSDKEKSAFNKDFNQLIDD